MMLLGFAAVLATHCAARQVRNEMELQEAAQRAAANDEKGWQSLERTIRTKDEDPDVEIQRKTLVEVGKIPWKLSASGRARRTSSTSLIPIKGSMDFKRSISSSSC